MPSLVLDRSRRGEYARSLRLAPADDPILALSGGFFSQIQVPLSAWVCLEKPIFQ